MRSPMATRTKAVLAVGFIIFVAGTAGAAYVGTRDAGRSGDPAGAQVTVLYAASAIDAGTAGSAALASGAIRTREVTPGSQPADAVTDAGQLSGRVASAAITPGTILTVDMFPPPQTRIGTLVIPPGKRALALELAALPGVAGFVGAGDHVDIYSVSKNGANGPGVRLVLQGVEVLNVNGAALSPSPGQPGGGNLVYLLAVTPAEAERLIYLTTFEALYFDLMPRGEAPVTTPGAGPAQVLQTL